MRRSIAVPAALAVLYLAGAAGQVQAGEASVRFSTGAEYSTGTYGGEEDIEEIYVPFTLRLGYERVGFRFTVPWLRVSETGAPNESGLGDVVATATLYDVFVSDYGDFVIDLTGKIKFGTADEQAGLGTGDIQELSGSVSHRINDDWRLEFYAFAGFGDYAADWGTGFFVTTDLRLFRGGYR